MSRLTGAITRGFLPHATHSSLIVHSSSFPFRGVPSRAAENRVWIAERSSWTTPVGPRTTRGCASAV